MKDNYNNSIDMGEVSAERLEEIVNNIALKCNINKPKYNLHQSTTTKIENYFGVLYPLTISGNKNKIIKAFVKLKSNTADERLREVVDYLFETEHLVYTSLIPKFFKLYDVKDLFPECYYANNQDKKEALVLEDMTNKRFQKFSMTRFLNFDHTIIAVKSLAVYHALSMILKGQSQTIHNDLFRPHSDVHPIELNNTLKLALENHTKYFKNTKYESFLKSLLIRYNEIRRICVENVRLFVYGHGDYWNDNILFKYEGKKPIQACIIDFQTVRLMSPSQDFLSFLMYSVDTTIRSQSFNELMSIYLETVNTALKEKGVQENSFVEDFKHDMRVVAENCVIAAFMAFALWFGLEEDTLVKSKDTANKNDGVAEFVKTIGDILNDMEKFDLIKL